MTRFDRFVVVDWSSANTPRTGADSIWIAELDGDAAAPVLSNPPTRRLAEDALRSSIRGAEHARTLVAIDVGLGYPGGTAASLGVTGRPWRATWTWLARRLRDDDRNRNDRFDVAAEINVRIGAPDGPFWGAPDESRAPRLRRTKPAVPPLPEFRHTELALRRRGRYPKSVWQLLGAGSVGSQSMTAIPVLDRLLAEFAGRIEVWPFTTGGRVPDTGPGTVVVAEVWPTMLVGAAPVGVVKDAHQVAATATALRTADRSGALTGWFEPELGSADRRTVEDEEGWVLGPAV